jgi:HK97 family phage prohead protease
METLYDLDLVRALRLSPEVRADGEGDETTAGLGRLEVRFSPFDTWYEISSWWEGDFLERTVRGAFRKTMLEQRPNIRCLYDHGYDFAVGNKVLCPTDDLREDADSAVLEGDLFDTTYNRDLLPGLRAGVYGSSFRFRVIRDEWNDDPGVSDHNPKGIPERTILEVRLYEAGPVTFPANPEATAGIRSMTDTYYERLRSRDPRHVDGLAERAAHIRTPLPPAAAESTARVDEGAAPQETDEPDGSFSAHHSDGHGPRHRRDLIFPFMKKGESQ